MQSFVVKTAFANTAMIVVFMVGLLPVCAADVQAQEASVLFWADWTQTTTTHPSSSNTPTDDHEST